MLHSWQPVCRRARWAPASPTWTTASSTCSITAPAESACGPQDALWAGKPGMDDYLFDMEHFLSLQAVEAAERAAGVPPDPLSWAPPALPADMVAPCGADVEAWYNAQCHLVVDARVRGARRLCPAARICVHVCWQQGTGCRRPRLGSGGIGGSAGWVRLESMEWEAESGGPRAHASCRTRGAHGM